MAQFAKIVDPKDMIEWWWVKDITDHSWEIRRLRRFKVLFVELGRDRLHEEQQAYANLSLGENDEYQTLPVPDSEKHSAELFMPRIGQYKTVDTLIASAELRRAHTLRAIERRREYLARDCIKPLTRSSTASSQRCPRRRNKCPGQEWGVVTSEAKIASNRRNAQRSTGPRTALAKARVRRNALRHGFAAVVVDDIATSTEVGRIAAALCDPQALPLDRERALIVAEAQVTLKRIRRARVEIMEQISPAPTKQSDEPGTVPSPQTESSQRCLDELLRIERYERRALSRRKRAARLLRTGFAASSLVSVQYNNR